MYLAFTSSFHSFPSFTSFDSFASFSFSFHSREHLRIMLSKLIKEKIEARFGKDIRYPKDCEALANHISESCRTRISSSTLLRLYGFVKGIREPRLHTLDIVAEYLGYKSWEELIASFDKKEAVQKKTIEKLKPENIKINQTVQIGYEPNRTIEFKKAGTIFRIVSSNERRLLLNDEIKFSVIELHYPLTLTHVIREGKSIGKVQVASVSGVTQITKG